MKPKKSSKPGRKRKSNEKASMSHMDKCTVVLKEVGAELHQMCMQMCNQNPTQYLVAIMYNPHHFQNFYMCWKFAVNCTPKEHQQLDAMMQLAENPYEALEQLLEFAVLHKKLSTKDLHKNIHMKTFLHGGGKSSTSRLQDMKKKMITMNKYKDLPKPGEKGFNKWLSNTQLANTQKHVQEIRNTPFECGKSKHNSKYWRYQPYQRSAMFLGSKACPFVKNLLVVAPTGSGKTAVVHNIVSSFMPDDRVTLFATPSSAVQRNFFDQIKDFDTNLNRFTQKYRNTSPEMLLSFNPQSNISTYNIIRYKTYLGEVRKINDPARRRKRANKQFGKESWCPHAPIRSVLFSDFYTVYETYRSEEEKQQFVHNVKENQPCVRRRATASGRGRLTTFFSGYEYDTEATRTRIEQGEEFVMNPFNNKIIVLDEADQLFKYQSKNLAAQKMLILMLKHARNSVVIGLTATPLVSGDEEYSDQTCKLLEMIKGRHGRARESNPLSKQLESTCYNEGFVSYYDSLRPPLYPMTRPCIGNVNKVVLGRIVFAELRGENRKVYTNKAKSFVGPQTKYILKEKFMGALMAYASSKYTDGHASRNAKILTKDFESMSSKSSCLFQTIMNCKEKKTLVLFTQGMKTMETYIRTKHPDKKYNMSKTEASFQMAFLHPSKHNDFENKHMLELFNSSKNVNGEYIRVMCATKDFFVGVNFKNVRRLILVSPPVSSALYIQTVGRVLRMCTYDVLPKEQRNVQIDILVATLDGNRKLADIEDANNYEELYQKHVTSHQMPVLTVDEMLLRRLFVDTGNYRSRMKQIFADNAIDRTWFDATSSTHIEENEELEAHCNGEGIGERQVYQKRVEESPEQTDYIKSSHIHSQPGSSSTHQRAIGKQDVKDMDRHARPIGQGKHKNKKIDKDGIGISAIKPYGPDRRVEALPQPLPVLDDVQEIKLAETKFKNLSFSSISEAEFNIYKNKMRVPNMDVNIEVCETAKDVEAMQDTMMQYTNSLMLARGHYPKVKNFGYEDNFHIEVLIAQAAKKWEELAAFYNKNFVGGSMQPWTKVVYVNIYYLPWKDRVYIQYEPNVRVVRPVLFCNLKAWIKSLGDKLLTEVDFHQLYQAMPEFRRPEDRVRYKGDQKPVKINAEGQVDISIEVTVPKLAGFNDEISAKQALSQSHAYNAIVQVYTEIMAGHFRVPMEQVRSRSDKKGHLIFRVHMVDYDILSDELEAHLNMDLLDPDPRQELLIPIKRSDGHVEEYVLKAREGVTSENLSQYIRIAVGSQLPMRASKDSSTHGHRHKNWFKQTTNSFPSSKEILNNHNGNIWILVSSDNKFRLHATKKPLPISATVDPFRNNHKFQEAKNKNEPFVLLDNMPNQPWQMVVTKPYASIRQFALHASDDEYNKFWKACLETKVKYEDTKGTTLYMYTDWDPALAQFHVNFSIDRPSMPKETPKAPAMQKPLPATQLAKADTSNKPKKQVHFAKTESHALVRKDDCAKPGDLIHLLLVHADDSKGIMIKESNQILVVMDPTSSRYTLPSTKWQSFKPIDKTYNMLDGQDISFTKDEEVKFTVDNLIQQKLGNIATNTCCSLEVYARDLSDGSKCSKVVVRHFNGLRTDVQLANHKWVSFTSFMSLKPVDDVIRYVQLNPDFMDVYLNNINYVRSY